MIIYTGSEYFLTDWPEGEYSEIEIELGRGSRLVVSPNGINRAKVVRLLSSDPADYLRPEYQPGNEIEFRLEGKLGEE